MKRHWLLIALIVSLAMNLFLVGLVAGRFWQEPIPVAARPGAVRAWAALDPERRREIRAWLVEQGRGARAELGPARQHRRRAAALFAAPDYDPAAVAAELDAASAIEQRVRQRVQRDMLNYATRLSPEERRAMGFVLGRNLLRTAREGGPQPARR